MGIKLVCPRCSSYVGGFFTRILWRIGFVTECPRCHVVLDMQRHALWAATSTLAGFSAVVGWVFCGVTGGMVVFGVCIVVLELIGTVLLRPNAIER